MASDATAVLLLAGLGNIGFRHLQGLVAVAHRIQLWGIDPDPGARSRAATEWRRSAGQAGDFNANLAATPALANIAILATSARGRLALFQEILAQARPNRLMLEKVAFQSVSDLRAAEALTRQSGTTVVVNCPRRLWPLYRSLRERLDGKPFSLSVRGRNIGMACNGVHYVDLLQFLARDSSVGIERYELGTIFESKRPGYFECLGRMRFRTGLGCLLDLSVREEDPVATEIEFTTAAGERFIVDEAEGLVRNPDSMIDEFGRAPYQSELTGAVVGRLLDDHPSGLATLAESAAAHEVILQIFTEHFMAKGFDPSNGVPIT